jgi:hypothetical protein
MKSWIAAGSLALALLTTGPIPASHAQSSQAIIGNGIVGAGVGAAVGAIAGGGRGAATGALIGGTVGAAGTAIAGAHAHPAPRYRGYARHRGCGPGRHWVPAHHNRWGEWRPGHCRH